MKHFKVFGWQIMHQAVDQVHPLMFVLLFWTWIKSGESVADKDDQRDSLAAAINA